MDESCNNCRFWLDSPQKKLCRYNPPAVMTIPQPDPLRPDGVTMKIVGVFPAITADQWCGKYEPKRAPGTPA